jgi:hypothetical protein
MGDIAVLNANLLFVIIVVSVCVGGIMILNGVIKEKKTHDNQE